MRKVLAIALLFSATFLKTYAQLMNPTQTADIPMRDGKTLAADIYIPSSCSSCPTILIQTPYNKNLFRLGLPLGFGQDLASSPYTWVIADWRGFYGSSAAATASPKRGEDGYDLIDWIVSQSWSDGKVGTWGPSALGVIQYQTAKENHPNHTCAVPVVAHPQTHYEGYFYGGVLEKSRLEQLDALGYGLSPIILANPYYNFTWQFSENSTWYPADIHIPTLQIGGWYDHNIDKMMDWYEATYTSADINVRDEQWLLIGPWVHGGTGSAKVGTPNQGELTYSNAAYVNDEMALDFFEYYLLNSSNGWENTPAITYYETGKDTWNSTDAASIENIATSELFLKENNILSGTSGTGSTSFISDPKNPSPTIGGQTLSDDLDQGPYDQITLEGRSDIATFTTGDLVSDVTISGRVKVNLYIECDQPDADIAVRLTDVYPDGRNMLINDGIKRARFRNGYSQTDEAFMNPGQVYQVEVELPFVHYTWKAGHEIKIYVSGNSSERWDVNLQNGDAMYTSGDTNTATIQIHHSPAYPSKMILPGNNPVLSVNSYQTNNNLLTVYPNPAKESVVIRTETSSTAVNYAVFDQLGQEVLTGTIHDQEKIDLSKLSPGIYFIQAELQGMIQNKKIIKE